MRKHSGYAGARLDEREEGRELNGLKKKPVDISGLHFSGSLLVVLRHFCAIRSADLKASPSVSGPLPFHLVRETEQRPDKRLPKNSSQPPTPSEQNIIRP